MTDALKIEPAYRTGTHPYHFRSVQQGLIIGVVLVNGRPCFVTLYDDGATDYDPIFEDITYYRIGSKHDQKD